MLGYIIRRTYACGVIDARSNLPSVFLLSFFLTCLLIILPNSLDPGQAK